MQILRRISVHRERPRRTSRGMQPPNGWRGALLSTGRPDKEGRDVRGQEQVAANDATIAAHQTAKTRHWAQHKVLRRTENRGQRARMGRFGDRR